MMTLLNMRLQEARFETIQHLQKEFPNAQLRIEIGKRDSTPLLLEQRFWEIIQLFDWSDPEDDDAVLKPAINAFPQGNQFIRAWTYFSLRFFTPFFVQILIQVLLFNYPVKSLIIINDLKLVIQEESFVPMEVSYGRAKH